MVAVDVAVAVAVVGVVVVLVGKVAGQECQQRLEDGRVARTLRVVVVVVVVLESSVARSVLSRQQRRRAARGIWQLTQAAGRIGERAGVSGTGRFVGTVGPSSSSSASTSTSLSLSAVAAIAVVLGTLWYGLHRSLGAN